jgi:hypothetical protein
MAPPTSVGGVQTGGPGWLSRAGEWVVERIDGTASLRFFSRTRRASTSFCLHTIEGTGGNGDWEGGRARCSTPSRSGRTSSSPRIAQGKVHIGQFMSMAVQARACKSPGNVGTIQVEIGGKAGDPFTAKDWLAEPVRALFQAVRVVYPAIPNVGAARLPGRQPRVRHVGAVAHRLERGRPLPASSATSTRRATTHWDPGAIDASVLLVVNAADPNPERGD